MPQIYDVLIVGAGLSGLKAARDLQTAGRQVLVLDKGRGVGGRAATRRWEGTPVDHGAQFFTARSEAFRAQTDDWLAREVCFAWTRGFHQYTDGALRAPGSDDSHPRYACRAGMSTLGKDLAKGLTVQTAARAIRLSRERDDSWQVEIEGDDGVVFAGRQVVLAMPVPQVLALLKDSNLFDALDSNTRGELEAVDVAPTLAVMLRGAAPAPGWQGIQLRDETVSWIGDDTSKRAVSPEETATDGKRVFVLHASGDFSRQWQDLDLNQAAERIVARAGEVVGDWITHLPERQTHRWRYAQVPHGVESKPFSCLLADDPTLSLCGDAFLGAKIEGAFCSGQQLARSLIGQAAK